MVANKTVFLLWIHKTKIQFFQGWWILVEILGLELQHLQPTWHQLQTRIILSCKLASSSNHPWTTFPQSSSSYTEISCHPSCQGSPLDYQKETDFECWSQKICFSLKFVNHVLIARSLKIRGRNLYLFTKKIFSDLTLN